jgi:hypothetical protein
MAAARSGPLSAINWIAEIVPAKGVRKPVRSVTIEETLFGTEVVAHGDGSRRQAFRLANHDDRLKEALVTFLCGARATGVELRDLSGLQVPIEGAELSRALDADHDALQVKLDRYRSLRADIDQRLAACLDA